ncbi:MAG: hypothetical protein IJC24_03135, partial [Clostridia bacterium]|nr:hypothetical protein [Clostridia bacterium]
MNRIKRFTAFMLIIGAILSLCSFALATEGYPEVDALDNSASDISANITIEPASPSFTENMGRLSITVKITNNNEFPIILAGIQPIGGAIVSASASAAGNLSIPVNSTMAIPITADLADSGNDPGTLTFLFNYQHQDSTQVVSANCSAFSIVRSKSSFFSTDTSNTTESDDTSDDKTEDNDSDDNSSANTGTTVDQPTPDTEFRIRTSSVDSNGFTVSTPSGDYGDDITLRLPLVCTKGYVYDVKVSPVVSTDIEKFPFDIELVDYTLCYSGYMSAGQVIEFMYPMRLSKKATVGVKQVDFNVTYRNGEGELKSGTVSLFVNVRKGLTAVNGDAASSVPRLIIESYSLSSDKIYAGETFDLNFELRNTSSSESIQNIQIRAKDADTTATIVPASGGSNSLYVSKISRGESSSQKISLQTAPDAEAKAYTLSLEFTYEAASTNAPHTTTETISIPILQKIRLKCDDPVVYDDMGWVGSSCSMYVRMYNMGR